jgi:hypothetical protein
VLESFVRDDARVREAPAWRKPITTYNPDGKAYRPRSTGLGRPKHPQLPNTSAPAPTVTLRFSVLLCVCCRINLYVDQGRLRRRA